MSENEKTTKPSQPATDQTQPPVIVVKPGGSEPGTTLRLFEEYRGEKKRELKKG